MTRFYKVQLELWTFLSLVTVLYSNTAGCPSGWSALQEKCIRLAEAKNKTAFANIYEAREICRAVGGDIVSLKSLEEENEILDFISRKEMNIHERVYIGLSDLLEEDNFTWFDGTNVAHSRWKDAAEQKNVEDEQNCVVIERSKYYWWSIQDTTWRPVACCQPVNVTLVICQLITTNEFAYSRMLSDIVISKCYKDIRCYVDVNLTSYRVHNVHDVINYSCPDDMSFAENPNVKALISQCQVTGDWVPEIPPCEVMTCGEPSSIQHGSYEVNGYLIHDQLQYTCDMGYQFQDRTTAKNATCTSTDWLPVINDCIAVSCPPIPTWKGIQPNTTSYTYGTAVSYTCNLPDPDDSNQINSSDVVYFTLCTANSTWFPSIQPCVEEPVFKKHVVEHQESISAILLGLISVLFLLCEIGLVILMDMNHLMRDFRILKRNVSEGMSRLRRNPNEEKHVSPSNIT